MADVDVAEQEVWNAERAQQLWNDPIMQKIMTETENQLILAVKSSTTPEQAYKAAIALNVFGLILNSIGAMIDTGKMAAIQLEQKRKWYERSKADNQRWR